MKVHNDLPERADGSIDLEAWVKRVGVTYSEDHQSLIRQAALLSLAKGGSALTPVQESCFRQGLLTAESLLVLQPDAETIAATIVYFPTAYSTLTIEEVQPVLGEKVAKLVAGVLLVSEANVISRDRIGDSEIVVGQSQRDNIRRMLLAIVEDVRVVLIRLAEQMTSLRAATSLPVAQQKKLAQDARDVYAPLANRLGIGQLKWEMEDYAFRYLQSDEYKRIAKLLSERRQDRDAYIVEVIDIIQEQLAAQGIEGDVYGRSKHIFSIWKKMQRKGLEFSDIYDVRAVRILVNELQDCYACLGIIHGQWKYVAQEFDDYIATPKENGYRSLHTAVVGPKGRVIEVQIRTYQMHQEAELGVAAHWLYKEGLKHDAGYHQKLATLRQILDWQEEVSGEEDDRIDGSGLVSEIFDDRVYVFTPRGDVVDLPKGSTALDFAYHIHTELGHRCRGTKANGSIVPLTYKLQSGDQIEILLAKEPKPSRDWMNPHLGYLRSSRAKAKVHAWYRHLDRDNNISAGRDILERESKRLGVDLQDLNQVAARFNLRKGDDVLAGIGRGDIRVTHVLNAFSEPELLGEGIERHALDKIVSQPKVFKSRTDVRIEGVGNLMCHYAKCCKPVPEDLIIGYITLGRGVTIHRKDCLNVLHSQEENEQRLIQVQWGAVTSNTYPVDIGIIAYDRKGLLNDITVILGNEKVNVTAVRTNTNEDNSATIYITLEISNLHTLGRVLTRILQLPNVLEAYRVRPGHAKAF